MASLALLQVTWDRHQKDFLDHFVPLIAEVIRSGEPEVVSLPSVQFGLQKQFGLHVPQHAIKLLLNRMCKRSMLRKDHGVYLRNLPLLNKYEFRALRADIVEKHDRLVQSLIRFGAREFGLKWDIEQGEKALAAYLLRNSFDIALSHRGSILPSVEEAPDAGDFIVAKFVQRLFIDRSADLDALMAIVKGHMLASALFLPDPSHLTRNFKRTQIFFDTRFLLSALGYHGESRQAPCQELLDLLFETGAQLRCFRHTLLEMQGAMHSAAEMMRRGRTSQAYGAAIETIAYFTQHEDPPAEIELRAASLERDLERFHVEVEDTPGWKPEHVIDEQGLASLIKERIKYFNASAVDRDVASVSAVMRLREGLKSDAVETCGAVFVTDNVSLVVASRDFLNQSGRGPVLVPACITDYTLTTLLWLKRPTAAPDLPMRTLAATCYAATQPDEQTWQRYLNRLGQMEREGKVTTDDYYLARYTYSARTSLMEKTLGGNNAFTEGTVTDILNRIKLEIASEQQTRLDASRAELESHSRREKRQLEHRQRLSRKVAHSFVQGLTIFIALGLALCVIATSVLTDWDPLKHGVFRPLAFAAAAAIGVLTYVGIWSGFAVAPYLRRFELKVEHLSSALLSRLAEPVPERR
jgi:hypothetical protein